MERSALRPRYILLHLSGTGGLCFCPSERTTRLPSLATGGAHESVHQVCFGTVARAVAFRVGRFCADRSARPAQCRGHAAGARSDARADRALPRFAAVADLHGLLLSARGGGGGALVEGESRPQGAGGRRGGGA